MGLTIGLVITNFGQHFGSPTAALLAATICGPAMDYSVFICNVKVIGVLQKSDVNGAILILD